MRRLGPLLALFWMMGFGRLAAAATIPAFDFAVPSVAASWAMTHDLGPAVVTGEGLRLRITGPDPYSMGPARDYPAGTLLWLNLRLRSDSGGTCQVFYWQAGTGPTEPNSVRFAVPAGDWSQVRVPIPALGPRYALRIDPPGDDGTCLLGRLWFEERTMHTAPAWPRPVLVETRGDDPAVVSGELKLVQRPTRWGAFTLAFAGHRLAQGNDRPLLGYLVEGKAHWWEFGRDAQPEITTADGSLMVSVTATDPDGARWDIRQRFAPGPEPGTLATETTVSVDRPRGLLYFPPLTLIAGMGPEGVGTNKQQALLAGVEYLDNEPSSSEADLTGTQSHRQVPDTARLTFPLAVLVADGRYLGIAWEMQPETAVVFDSPDRLFQSGGHLMGLIQPGSDGLNRDESSLVPYDALTLEPGKSLGVRALLLAGTARDATTAVQQYVRLRGLPPVPATGYSAPEYFRLAARGWLDTSLREGNLFRHAVVGSFAAGPAADAAYYMDWLADRVEEPILAGRLKSAAIGALAQVPANHRYASGVGHVRYPVAPLVYGAVAENTDTALAQGQPLLRRFERAGTIRYVPSAGGLDYGRTHWTNEANGLTAQVVQSVLEAAAFSGDRALTAAGIQHLKALAKFRGGVPRGAQTWEVPLHTPDILASAHLVRAYTLGFELTGDPLFLDEAKHWAWTGVTFVYLRDPTSRPVGRYATTPVLGATQWVAPNWIGLPVQWCGLVYADSLHNLARHDPTGPWRQLADGIAASGVQQTYPATDPKYAGLLPDSFALRGQQRNPANINPATLLALATRLMGQGPVYDAYSFRRHGIRVHAPGLITPLREDEKGLAFRVEGWPQPSHRILLHGVGDTPEVSVNGRSVALVAPHSFSPSRGRLVLELKGPATVELVHPIAAALRIERRDDGWAVVSWRESFPAWTLEKSASLDPAATWNPSTLVAPSGGGWSTLVVPTEASHGFFRLIRPGG